MLEKKCSTRCCFVHKVAFLQLSVRTAVMLATNQLRMYQKLAQKLQLCDVSTLLTMMPLHASKLHFIFSDFLFLIYQIKDKQIIEVVSNIFNIFARSRFCLLARYGNLLFRELFGNRKSRIWPLDLLMITSVPSMFIIFKMII